MEEDDQIDEVLAYHEAGHAVVAWSLGFKILEISLGSRVEGRGFCKDSLRIRCIEPEFMSKADWTQARSKVQILLAGEMAESLYHSANESYSEEFCSIHDRAEIDDLSQKLFFENMNSGEVWVKEAEEPTNSILVENWEKVCVIAQVLKGRRSISGVDAEFLLNETDIPI